MPCRDENHHCAAQMEAIDEGDCPLCLRQELAEELAAVRDLTFYASLLWMIHPETGDEVAIPAHRDGMREALARIRALRGEPRLGGTTCPKKISTSS